MPTVVLLEIDALEDELAGRAASPGLLPLAGHPMVTYAARAFRACGNVTEIAVAGPEAYREQPAALAELDGAPILAESVAERVDLALDRFADRDELLFWPANAPLLTPEAIESFLTHAPVSAGLCWSCVRHSRVQSDFPELETLPQHKFGTETFCLGGLGSVKPAAIAEQRDLLRRMLGQPLTKGELTKLLGVGFAIKYASARASLTDLMNKISEVLGVECVATILPHPELCFRVRNRAEHHVARAMLEER